MLQYNIGTLQNNRYQLFNERSELQQFVSRFRNSDRRYLQTKRLAEEVVDRLLAERKSLLTSALIAVVEALRMNPDRYAIIYNAKYDNNDDVFESITRAAAISSSHSSTKAYQNHYYNEYHEGILETANSLLKILLNQLVDETTVAVVKEK